MFLRLLFSALVDADFLDTESHFSPSRQGERATAADIPALWRRFEASRDQFADSPKTDVNRVRSEVYDACIAAASGQPGLFRLTVPTGGGKTLSGLAFALRHAVTHSLRRVVIAVPFITVTEQTAQAIRSALDLASEPSVVLEHHSNAATNLADEDNSATVWPRLAAENWDAPVVVTTTVQLFESLFANGPSRCRKLHRLARSVIVLDEAQSLPPHLLAPILDATRALCSDYGSTVVLSTATQPAFEAISVFAGLDAREIVPGHQDHFARLRRVHYEWRREPTVSWNDLAAELREQMRVLVVVNTKAHAGALFDALADPGALHLSSLMCGAHRRDVVTRVRRLLAAGEPCRVVSTQLVEAGIDLDFPVVYRAEGPLDAIIQAAGRCNREGVLGPQGGRVVIFRAPDESMPPGAYRAGASLAVGLLAAGADPSDPAVPPAYFRQLFATVDIDRERIQPLREALDYPEVARRFQMIEDSESVVIDAYGPPVERARVASALDMLRNKDGSPRMALRVLQPYIVNLRPRAAQAFRDSGQIEEIIPGVGLWRGAYDDHRGLNAEAPEPLP
jgi:CRISPR-associated endonuclease/helicase Cas3